MIKVAVFPAGTEIGLEINRSLQYSIHIELHGLASVMDHSKYVYKNYSSEIPFFTDKNFILKINNYIMEHNIDYIFPAHDDVQLFLTENKNKIQAEIVTSDLSTVRICRSKIETYRYFADYDFVPNFIDGSQEVCTQKIKYPVFVKPDIGQGSKGAIKINSKEELDLVIKKDPNLVICEFLPGEEFTIDCFSDYNGNLRVSKMRNRNRIKSGISVNSKMLKMDSKVLEIAHTINNNLNLNGAWFFQLKKDEKNCYKLLEIAPRVSGTMGLSRNTGVNYALLSLFNKMENSINIINNNYEIEVDRSLFSRYKLDFAYDTIYLDLDDTIIIKNKVNSFLMMFIFQALNEAKEIHLLTKHEYDVSETLKRYHLPKELFKEIIHIPRTEKKSEYIKSLKSIFIDDSFAERYDVSANVGIPVFDSSEVESLIDWRI